MNVGKLRHRITLETKPAFADASVDAHNQEIEVWTPVLVRWGAVEPLSGRELAIALQIRNDLTHKITTRYVPDLVMGRYRWTMNGRIFNPQSARLIDEVAHVQEFLCTEVVS